MESTLRRTWAEIDLDALAQNYNGVKKSEREDCEKMIGLQTGSQINTDIINRAKYYIKKHFEDKGFNNCEVEIMQREDVTGDNKVIVDININKNEKIKIHRIHITGLDDKKERIKVKKAMKKTREHKLYNFFRSKKYVPEKFEEDKANTIENTSASEMAVTISALITGICDADFTIFPSHLRL